MATNESPNREWGEAESQETLAGLRANGAMRLERVRLRADDVIRILQSVREHEGRAERLDFYRCEFVDSTTFQDFRAETAGFIECRFQGISTLRDVTVDDLTFSRSEFEMLDVRDLRVERACFFTGATFSDMLAVTGLHVGAIADFERAVFGATVFLSSVKFDGGLSLRGARFADGADRVSLLAVRGELTLDGIVAESAIRLSAYADRISLRNAYIPRGAVLEFGTPDLQVDGTHFGAPSLLTSLVTRGEDEDLDTATLIIPGESESDRTVVREVALKSMARADVASLTLSDVNLFECRFLGAHNLDGLRIGPDSSLPHAPISPGYARRLVIADEADARMVLSDPDETDPARRATLQAVASTYRALRAGLETRRDAPGAADFYYGEMEMRRLASPHFSSERTLLTLYWSLSGYGLRASRSLLALFALTIASAFVFDYVGFASSQPTFGRALIASFASELPFIRGLGIPELTTTGEAMKIVLGVAGPILCGLTLLALRGRVRR